MTLKLFYSTGACSLASHIALEEAGADYEAVRISLKDGDQRKADYLQLNPKGRVPALVTDAGVLTENLAILAYVAQAYPEAKLAPLHDPFAFARAQAFNSYLASTLHVAMAHRVRGYRWADDPAAIAEMARKAPLAAGEAFRLIETEMFEGPYVLGDAFSICDAYLFVFESWLSRDGVDTEGLPRILDHYRRVGERPAVRKVLAEEAA